VKKLAFMLLLLLLGSLAACQLQPAVAPTPANFSPTSTTTAVPPAPTARPTNTPVPALNSPNGPPLRILKMFTAQDGWGLIYNSLLLTHDGGISWYSVPLSAGQINEETRLFFVDVNTIYIVLPTEDAQVGQLLSTSNGGGSWQTNPVPFSRGQIAAADQRLFFLETTRIKSDEMSVAIFTSVDNGLSWNRVFPGADQASASFLPNAGIKTGLSFISPERGWLGLADQHQKVVLYKTEDGGQSWAPQEIPLPQNITSLITSSYPPVFFPGNKDEGLLPVDFVSMDTGDRNRVFFTTSDGGINWLPGASVVDAEAYTFLDAKTGWVWGKRGLYFTVDSAQTWQLLPVAFGRSEKATCVSFVDAKSGWLLTTDAKNRVRIYSTRDGGNTWTAINP